MTGWPDRLQCGPASSIEEEPMQWRTVITDRESESGVAPICPQQNVEGSEHDHRDDPHWPEPKFDVHGVYDCCPQPHLQLPNEKQAHNVAAVLSWNNAEMCD